MEKILGNFLAQPNNDFPLDCETLDYLQKNIHMAEMLGAIAGDKIILSGCGVSGSWREKGYVFLMTDDFPEGEVLHFMGGDAAHTTMYLEKTAISVTANADPYPNAYTQRILKAGLAVSGAEQFNWSDFAPLSNKTNRQLLVEIQTLRAQIATLQPAPTGSIMMWASNTIPTGWALCDGSSYSRSEYAELFAVLGTTYGSNDNSSFNIPNMMERFVVGKGKPTSQGGYQDYDTLNKTGGQNKVALAINEIPKHQHGISVLWDNQNRVSYGFRWGQSDAAHSAGAMYSKTFCEGAGGNSSGNTDAHENRPPYIVLNYIIKLK